MKIEKKLLSAIFNSLDMPIRYIYSNFSIIQKILYKSLYVSDFVALNSKFEYIKNIFDENEISIQDKVILEIGPGNSLMFAYNFLLNGAKKIILVDKFPLNKNKKNRKTHFQQNFLQKEQNFIINKYDKALSENIFKKIESEQLIEYHVGSLEELEKIEPIDIIVSNSVFEHIRNPQPTIESSFKILKNKAFAFHSIDLRDHYNFSRPFLFYKYSDKLWNNYLTKVSVSYTNRLRYFEFANLFTNAGFKLCLEKKIEFPQTEKKIADKFRNRDDLSIAHIDFLLQKQS